MSTFANIGVVLGLIFLGIEVYQSNQMNRTVGWNNLIQSGIDFNDTIAQNADLAEILAKSNNNETLSDAEAIRMRAFTAASMQRFGWIINKLILASSRKRNSDQEFLDLKRC